MSRLYSWPLDNPPVPAASVGAGANVPMSIGVSSPASTKRGILIPFRRDQKNDFANGGGKAIIRSHLEQILGTRAGNGVMQGEYRWRSSFGSLLELIRHRTNSPMTRELARSYVVDAVGRWTKTIRVTDVDLVELPALPNVLVIRVWYEITRNGIREADVVDVELANIGR